MILLDMTIPGWFGQALMIFAALGGGAWITHFIVRKYPTVKDKTDVQVNDAEIFDKKFNQGLAIYEHLQAQVKILVEKETKKVFGPTL
jgi:hypothetical protein